LAVKFFSRSERPPILQDWLMAGLHAGLSPVEWAQESAPISRRWARPHAIGAKATNGPANGASRTLDISDFLGRNLWGGRSYPL
jgi:hypothetical protein